MNCFLGLLAIGSTTHLISYYLEFDRNLQDGLLVATLCISIVVITQCGDGKTESIFINFILGILTQYVCYYFALSRIICVINALITCYTLYLAANKVPTGTEDIADKVQAGQSDNDEQATGDLKRGEP